MKTMKVIRKEKKTRRVTLRIEEEVMKRVDEVAKTHKKSRQKIIESILKQVTQDKSFVLHLD
jgi:metal-responsive CopG/Arc/MetJ family transcriptional regulator